MRTDSAEQVAADHSATVETPAEGVEAAEEAESVEVSPPQPVDSVAKTSQSWAGLSEVQDSPVPSGVDSATVSAHPQGSLVKEEIHEAETISAVIATTGFPEEVADESPRRRKLNRVRLLIRIFWKNSLTRIMRPKLLSRTSIVQKRNGILKNILRRVLLRSKQNPSHCVVAGTDNVVDGATAIFQFWHDFWRDLDAGRPAFAD